MARSGTAYSGPCARAHCRRSTSNGRGRPAAAFSAKRARSRCMHASNSNQGVTSGGKSLAVLTEPLRAATPAAGSPADLPRGTTKQRLQEPPRETQRNPRETSSVAVAACVTKVLRRTAEPTSDRHTLATFPRWLPGILEAEVNSARRRRRALHLFDVRRETTSVRRNP